MCKKWSDVVVVWKFGRFARSLKRVKSGIANARANGEVLADHRSPTDSNEIADPEKTTKNGKLTFRILAKIFGVSVWTAHSLCAGTVG